MQRGKGISVVRIKCNKASFGYDALSLELGVRDSRDSSLQLAHSFVEALFDSGRKNDLCPFDFFRAKNEDYVNIV